VLPIQIVCHLKNLKTEKKIKIILPISYHQITEAGWIKNEGKQVFPFLFSDRPVSITIKFVFKISRATVNVHTYLSIVIPSGVLRADCSITADIFSQEGGKHSLKTYGLYLVRTIRFAHITKIKGAKCSVWGPLFGYLRAGEIVRVQRIFILYKTVKLPTC